MGNVRLYGSTSGYTELAPPAVAPDGVLSLPSGTGTLLTAEGGKVLQVVRASDATSRSTTSTSYVDVTGMSVTITPTKTTSVILIICTGSASATWTTGVNQRGQISITDSSNGAISGAQGPYAGMFDSSSNAEFYFPFNLIGYATPATTSAVTYKLRFLSGAAGTTFTIRNNEMAGQIFAIEVSA
jgi:hypothetical protein